MTTERSSYGDPGGADAMVATREDELSDNGSERLQDAASGVADRVADTAQQQVGARVDTGMTKAGEMLEQVANAVRQSGDQLRTDQPQVAGFADTAAEQVDRFARYLRDTNAQDLMGEAESFARRQPAIFLGGAMALGLLASRFLKASPRQGASQGQYRGYTSPYASRYGYSGSMGGNGYPTGYSSGTGYSSDTGYSSGTGYSTGSGYAGSSETGVENGGA
jgi:ABC-type transporter Mla subunit MlaD